MLAVHALVALCTAAACLPVDPPAVGLPRGLLGGAQSSADFVSTRHVLRERTAP